MASNEKPANGDARKEKKTKIIDSDQMLKVLNTCYEKALDGIPKVSKSVDDLANDYLSHYKTPEDAARALINNQIIKCTASGFITGLGGLITMPIAIPANISSVLYVQLRMIAAVAKIGGFDPGSDQVQTFVYACLAGKGMSDILKEGGVALGVKLTTAAIAKISGATLAKINQAVGFRLITKFGETGLINLGKAVPFVGAAVNGAFDFATTKIISQNAYKLFISNTNENIIDEELEYEVILANADVLDVQEEDVPPSQSPQ